MSAAVSQPRDVPQELNEHLRELCLPAVRRCFEEKARQAERETLGYEHYLLELVERECQERRANRTARLLQASKLPLEKTLQSFDMKRLPVKAARQVKALLDGGFLDRRENVLAFGNPGSGKTGERAVLLPDSVTSPDKPASSAVEPSSPVADRSNEISSRQ